MTSPSGWPRKGDAAVEYRPASRHGAPARLGEVTTVVELTPTLVLTADGGRYGREHLRPIREGRSSAWQLVSPADDRVICARGRGILADAARQAANLAAVEHTDPAELAGALARLVVVADDARRRYLAQMTEATR